MKKLFYFVLLFLIAPQVFAGPFDPPPTDQSLHLLGVIFGDSIGSIYLGGASNPVLSNLMEKFNFIMVVVGTFVVSYVSIISVINTAHEGSAMGKKWSAVWTPMRSVAGMALMVPAPASGYSMIQVTVMWIVLQGIGAADTLWNIALDGLANGVSATAGTVSRFDPRLTPDSANVKNLVQQLLNASICMQSLYQSASTTENVNGKTWVNQNGQYLKNFSVADDNSPSISGSVYEKSRVASMTGYSYFGVNNGNANDMQMCGKLRVEGIVTDNDFKNFALNDLKSITDEDMKNYAVLIYNTKLKAISTMLGILNPLATGYVKGDYSSNVYSAITGTNPPDPVAAPGGYALAAANAYVLAMKGLVKPLTAHPGEGKDAYTNQAIESGQKNGWITAGGFYFIFNKTLVSSIFNNATSPITNPDQYKDNPIPFCNDSIDCISKMTAYRDYTSINNSPFEKMASKEVILDNDLNTLAFNLLNGQLYLNSEKASESLDDRLSLPESNTQSNEILAAFSKLGYIIIGAMVTLMESVGGGANTDPLLAHALFGNDMMLSVESAFAAILAILVATAAMSMFPIVGAIYGHLSTILLGILALLFPLAAIIWGMGAMLAIYCPLIPYMIFTISALGWAIVVVEAIIAAPVVALGLVLPSSDDLSNLHHALTILANIFLRPMLMVFGFILAGGVYKGIVQFIDFSIVDVIKSVGTGTIFSPFVLITIYITFITSVTNQCFSLIYAVPDRILRWIGGSAENTQSDLSEIKGKAEGAASGVGGGIQELGTSAGAAAKDRAGKLINQDSGMAALKSKLPSLGKKK